MKGYVTCKHCKGVGKTYKWFIFPKRCPYCKGLGFNWMGSTRELNRNDLMKGVIINGKIYELVDADENKNDCDCCDLNRCGTYPCLAFGDHLGKCLKERTDL